MWVRNQELSWELPEALDSSYFEQIFPVKPEELEFSPVGELPEALRSLGA